MWVKCFFIETSWSQFLFLVSYVFWSLQQLTFSNKAHVHCLDLILQIFSTDTSYLVLKDTSRIPSPFSRPLDVFASLEDLWPFQTPQTNRIYSVLLQNKPEDLSKLLEKKCGEKKSENCQTVQHVCCWNHRNTLRHWQTHSVHFLSEDTNNHNMRDYLKLGCVLYTIKL